jgi:hypothetical protein
MFTLESSVEYLDEGQSGPLEDDSLHTGVNGRPFFGDQITIDFFDPLPTAEIAPIIDALTQRFTTARAERHRSPPWASPLLEYAAITVAIATPIMMKGFLEELGKDLWRGVRQGPYRLYETAKKRAIYPSFHAFARHHCGRHTRDVSNSERLTNGGAVREGTRGGAIRDRSRLCGL